VNVSAETDDNANLKPRKTNRHGPVVVKNDRQTLHAAAGRFARASSDDPAARIVAAASWMDVDQRRRRYHPGRPCLIASFNVLTTLATCTVADLGATPPVKNSAISPRHSGRPITVNLALLPIVWSAALPSQSAGNTSELAGENEIKK
jgi:hypothetical protein